jgi:hypothetical protein
MSSHTEITPINDSYARLMCLDGYANQPEIVEWPMSDLEWMEMQTLDALAASDYAENLYITQPPQISIIAETPAAYAVSAALQEFFEQQPIEIYGNVTIQIFVHA